MGTSTSWIAVAGADLEKVAQQLGLAPLPDRAQTPAMPDALYEAAVLESGWILLVKRLENNGVVAEPAPLAALSHGWRVIGCDEESHVMYSASSEWRKGREAWAIVHASERAADHLDVRGEPPPEWATIRDELRNEQATAEEEGSNVDYVYEIPLVVAERVVGYRTDSEDSDDLRFVALGRRLGRSQKPWWKLW
jgi:hypothetical protein